MIFPVPKKKNRQHDSPDSGSGKEVFIKIID